MVTRGALDRTHKTWCHTADL